MSNGIIKTDPDRPKPMSQLPGEDHVAASDLTKSFVSLEAVESLVLDESREMLALTSASVVSGMCLMAMLFVALLGKALPEFLIAVPWWLWVAPSVGTGVLWLRVRRQRRRVFRAERDEWVGQLRENAQQVIKDALLNNIEMTKQKQLQEWPPLVAAQAVVVRMGVAAIGLDNSTNTIGCDVEIISLSPRRCSVSIQGGSVAMYRTSEPGIEKLKPSIERVRSVKFDGRIMSEKLPMAKVGAYALILEPRMQEIRDAFRGDVTANVLVSITYTVAVDDEDVGEATIQRHGTLTLLPTMIKPQDPKGMP